MTIYILNLDVAAALSDLINTIKLVSSGSLTKESVNRHSDNASTLSYSGSLLSESAKVMITNIQSLLKTVKTVEDEAQRGTRALESAIDAIHQEIRLNTSSASGDLTTIKSTNGQSSENQFTPDDLIKATKQITMATSKAIGAANSMRQEDIIVVANMGRKAVSDLLYVCQCAISKLTRDKQRESINETNSGTNYSQQIMTIGLSCANYYKDLLECIQAVIIVNIFYYLIPISSLSLIIIQLVIFYLSEYPSC